jgi:hypothetical protein
MEEPADGHDENMHSSSQVAVAAVDLSCTEGSEVDILDVSIQNMSIHGKFVFNTFLVTLFSGVLFFTIHNFLNFIVRYIAFNIEDFLDSH